MKDTEYGRNVLKFITLSKNLKIGDRYANFTQNDTMGRKVSLADFEGKLVLVEFWGSWCRPCRKGHPELINIYNEFKARGFEILGVAADSEEKAWKEAVRKDSLPWINISDLKGDKNEAGMMYDVSYFPANFLISPDGRIIAKDLRGEALRDKLRAIYHTSKGIQ